MTVCCFVRLVGAVYRPDELTDPLPVGLIDQLTAVLFVFTTLAENCCVCPALSVAVVGVTLTATAGISVTVAVADLVESAWLVAVMVTVCCDVMLAGAVYSPDELTVPMPAGLIAQLTAVLLAFATVTENC